MSYRFVYHSVLTRAFLGEFLTKDVTFNSPLRGPGGQFSGIIVLDDKRQTADVVKPATELDTTAVYVIYKDDQGENATNTEQYIWGGIINKRTWNRRERKVTIQAVEFKSWLYTVMYSPSITPPFADRKFNYTATDQLAIARALINDVVSRLGTPAITVPVSTSTRTRDMTFFASEFKVIGDQIDNMADRSDGFDWNLDIIKSFSDGLPELVARMYYPERGVGQSLSFSSVRNQLDIGQDGRGTILSIEDWTESSENRRTRVWATGAGGPPDQAVAMDDDPLLDTEEVLLRETSFNFGGVSVPATLSEHARAERIVLGVETESIDIAIKPNLIKPIDFSVGDRAALRVRDEWLDVDEPDVRIVDKAIAPFSSQEGERIVVTLDLSDATPPDPDEGDTV